MTEMGYNAAELSKLRYVKVIYTGLDNKQHEIKTEVKFLGEALISLYFRYKQCFDIQYPQEVTIKFVTGLYIAKSTLQEIKKDDNLVYFTIVPPARMEKRQNRRYYRINLKRTCVLVATDANGNSSGYMSRLVDVSAGGLLIHKLESMFSDEYVTIDPLSYKYFNIVLFLDIDTVLKLSAKFIRWEKGEESSRYAFEFMRMKQSDIDTISKYVNKEQIEQLKMQQQLHQSKI